MISQPQLFRSSRRSLLLFFLIVAQSVSAPGIFHRDAAAQAEEEPADLRALIPAAIDYYNEATLRPIPGLGKNDLQSLLRGKVVVIRRKEKNPEKPEEFHHRVFGYLLVGQPLRSVWLSGNDPDYLRNSTYTLAVYDRDGHGGNTAYVYVRTPWPVADRQTVTKVMTNVELAESSGDWIWEQRWDIAPNEKEIAHELVSGGKVEGVDLEMLAKAVWVPVNYGAFICFKLEEKKTLFVWTITASVGGRIPDNLVAAFAANQLKSSLREIADRAAWIEKDYREHPDEIFGGDGKIIQPLTSP